MDMQSITRTRRPYILNLKKTSSVPSEEVSKSNIAVYISMLFMNHTQILIADLYIPRALTYEISFQDSCLMTIHQIAICIHLTWVQRERVNQI